MMKTAIRLTLLITLPISSVLFCLQPAFAQSLKDVVEQTVESNPDVLIAAKQRLSTDEAVKEARAGYYPKVDLGLGIGHEWSENTTTRPGSDDLVRRESSLSLTQMLYDGYNVKSEVDRQTARQESAAYKVAGTSEQLGLRAVETYLDVLRRQELLVLTQENLATHERTFEQIKLRSDSGIGRKADLEQAQARLSLSQANLVSAQANLREANISFQRVVGTMPDALEKVTEVNCELFPTTVDEAIQAVYANYPLLRSANADYEAALAQESTAESFLKPRLDLELGANSGNDEDGVDYKDNNASAMLRLRYNIFRGGIDQARVSQAQYQSNKVMEAMNLARRQVEESARLSWNTLQTSISRLPKLKAFADASEKTRDAYVKQFSIGQRTLLDLLDSENELYLARSDYVNGQYRERFARYQLITDMGKLLSTLGVAPREESQVTSAAQP